MLKYDETSAEEKINIYNNAFTWLHDHADHVNNLIREAGPCVAPSGSDMFKPELWKAIHWRWFFKFNKG